MGFGGLAYMVFEHILREQSASSGADAAASTSALKGR